MPTNKSPVVVAADTKSCRRYFSNPQSHRDMNDTVAELARAQLPPLLPMEAPLRPAKNKR
jgi:hypothetical protein